MDTLKMKTNTPNNNEQHMLQISHKKSHSSASTDYHLLEQGEKFSIAHITQER